MDLMTGIVMRRSSERLIDAFVLMMMLVFAWLMREEQPALAGVIVMAALKFWMDKNASEPHPSVEEAVAKAAAEVLAVAKRTADRAAETPIPVIGVDGGPVVIQDVDS